MLTIKPDFVKDYANYFIGHVKDDVTVKCMQNTKKNNV
jgi:hypothetical protein